MYKGEADWTLIGKIKENQRMHIPVFGNGDINSPQKAVEYKNRYGVDGIMIGRASIGNPWIFRERLGIVEMRRHYTNYFRGFRDIKPIRGLLVTEDNPAVIYETLEHIRHKYSGDLQEAY
jgi:tRNA-dihydrouridine synthase